MMDMDKYRKYLKFLLVLLSIISILIMITTFLNMAMIDNLIFLLIDNDILLVFFSSSVGLVFLVMYINFIIKIFMRKKIEVFLSYTYSNEEDIKKIRKLLSLTSNYKVYDFNSILIGQDIQVEIKKMIDTSSFFIILLDKDYFQSEHCLMELETIIDSGKVIVPILKSRDHISKLPPEILKLKYLIISDDETWEITLKQSLYEQYGQIRKIAKDGKLNRIM